ncbi:hypothetical protein [Mucilaginibacter sp.]|uniref:MarR family winged helix-turn-helix transcriptional regulator n=1 Tax=Mucilaginibacter sp. TaxID=1882438 RepID=UPI003266D005
MKKKGLVTEFDDEQDKRVKRLKVTAKGEQTLMKAKDRVLKVANMMLHDMSDDDKRLCLQLLKPVNSRFSGMYQKQKNKPFEDIYQENLS